MTVLFINGYINHGSIVDGSIINSAMIDGSIIDGSIIDGYAIHGSIIDNYILDCSSAEPSKCGHYGLVVAPTIGVTDGIYRAWGIAVAAFPLTRLDESSSMVP